MSLSSVLKFIGIYKHVKAKNRMPYRMLCNDVQREGAEASPGIAFGLYYYVPLHNIRYGIVKDVYGLFLSLVFYYLLEG